MDDDIVSSVYVVGANFMYCLPAFIALWRGHPSCIQILIVNLSLGWTVIGWVGTLVWAVKRVNNWIIRNNIFYRNGRGYIWKSTGPLI
jgi:hypothetical protein